jgi:hypothetical protein
MTIKNKKGCSSLRYWMAQVLNERIGILRNYIDDAYPNASFADRFELQRLKGMRAKVYAQLDKKGVES